MEKLTIFVDGIELISGRSVGGETLRLIETEDQLVLQIGGRLSVAEVYDFDYRGLVDELEEQLCDVDYMAWDMVDIVNDWEEVECNCQVIKKFVTNYFKKEEFKC